MRSDVTPLNPVKYFQVLVGATPWRFKSSHPHHSKQNTLRRFLGRLFCCLKRLWYTVWYTGECTAASKGRCTASFAAVMPAPVNRPHQDGPFAVAGTNTTIKMAVFAPQLWVSA